MQDGFKVRLFYPLLAGARIAGIIELKEEVRGIQR
jgi:hypothetical protein